jgi:hypothetical protein
MADYWNELAPEVREQIELGEASVKRLTRGEHIEWWLNAGRALAAMQAEAMRHAGINVNKGPRYVAAWKVLARHAPALAALEKSDRSHAVWLATEWEAVNAWLQTLGMTKRLTLNHPRAIHRSYNDAHLPPKPAAETVAPPRTPTHQIEVLDIVKTLRGGGVFPPGTPMSHVADALDAGLSYDALRRLHLEIGKRLANHERQDRIEDGVKQKHAAKAKTARV